MIEFTNFTFKKSMRLKPLGQTDFGIFEKIL